MIDRLIITADKSGSFLSTISNKNVSAADKDQERRTHVKRFKWIENLTLRTFHSFCYSVLRNFGVNEFDNRFKIIGDEKRDEDDELSKYVASETAFEVFHKQLIELCNDSNYLLRLKRYILDYVVDKIHVDRFRRNLPRDGKFFTTLNGIKVRSKSEQYIADWLYRHNFQFEYERFVQSYT